MLNEKMNDCSEEKTCPACGKTSPMELDEKCPQVVGGELIDYAFFRCPSCSSSHASPPIPAPPEFYDYDEGDFDFGMPQYRWEFGEFIRDIERLLPDGGTILEIGCGEGAMLERMDSERYKCVGVDFNQRAIEIARKKGIDCFSCDFRDIGKHHDCEKFDAIAFFHVLEHVVDPYSFLMEVSARLMPGGIIAFSVPNEDRIMLSAGRDIWDYPPNHLHRYSLEGLQALIDRAKIKALKVECNPRDVGFFRFWSFRSFFFQRRLRIGWTYDQSVSRAFRIIGKIPFFVLCLPIALLSWSKNHRRHGVARYIFARPK